MQVVGKQGFMQNNNVWICLRLEDHRRASAEAAMQGVNKQGFMRRSKLGLFQHLDGCGASIKGEQSWHAANLEPRSRKKETATHYLRSWNSFLANKSIMDVKSEHVGTDEQAFVCLHP
eukprot:1161785-Pelagomonas_calceolata.AAC.7